MLYIFAIYYTVGLIFNRNIQEFVTNSIKEYLFFLALETELELRRVNGFLFSP